MLGKWPKSCHVVVQSMGVTPAADNISRATNGRVLEHLSGRGAGNNANATLDERVVPAFHPLYLLAGRGHAVSDFDGRPGLVSPISFQAVWWRIPVALIRQEFMKVHDVSDPERAQSHERRAPEPPLAAKFWPVRCDQYQAGEDKNSPFRVVCLPRREMRINDSCCANAYTDGRDSSDYLSKHQRVSSTRLVVSAATIRRRRFLVLRSSM